MARKKQIPIVNINDDKSNKEENNENKKSYNIGNKAMLFLNYPTLT